MSAHHIFAAAALTILGACTAPTEPVTSTPSVSLSAARSVQQQDGAQQLTDESCSFSRGTTSCVTTVQYTETSTHAEYSGCLYGPDRVPGARVRTFSDTDLVTVTTTTLRRGKSNHVFDSSTVTTRQRLSSTQISDACSPL
jgi:hypothetical protein